MKIKKLILTLAILNSLNTSLFAKNQWAIGGALGSPTAVLNILVPLGALSLDLDIGWSLWSINNSFSSFFTSVDFLLWEQNIANQLHLFIGVGPRFGFWSGVRANSFFIGPRAPIGIDWQPFQHLSLFFKVAPGLGFKLGDQFSTFFSFDFGFGARFVF